MAILAALLHRDNTGQGQHIDVAVHDCVAVTTEMHIPTYIYHGKVVIRQTGRHAQMEPNATAQFRCADVIVPVGSDVGEHTEPFDDLSARTRTGEALQQLLQHEARGVDRLRPFKRLRQALNVRDT